MKKKTTINLVLSAFLVIAFVVCTYFFCSIEGLADSTKNVIEVLAAVVFGLVLFYATRVGEGTAVKRFSIATLLILVLPALYIILASIVTKLPFGEQLTNAPLVTYLASVALGYGIPYTFISGFELVSDEETEGYLEGGLLEEIESTEETDDDTEETDALEEEGNSVEVEINC